MPIKKKKRKYYRTCPICGEKHGQSDMIRTDRSDTGWLCKECYEEHDYIFNLDDKDMGYEW